MKYQAAVAQESAKEKYKREAAQVAARQEYRKNNPWWLTITAYKYITKMYHDLEHLLFGHNKDLSLQDFSYEYQWKSSVIIVS